MVLLSEHWLTSFVFTLLRTPGGQPLKHSAYGSRAFGGWNHRMTEDSREEWVELETFGSSIEAEVARTKLLSDGIPAYVTKDDEGGMTPQLQYTMGVRLYVAKSSVQAAAKSLKLKKH